MKVRADRIDSLFFEAAKRVQTAAIQHRDSVIQLSYQRLRVNAGDVDALHVIAAANLQDQRPERSLSLLQRQCGAVTNNAAGHRLTAYALLAQNQPDEACTHFDAATRIDPCHHDSWTMLGQIHEESGRTDRAAAYYERAIHFADSNHESALALSRLQAKQNNLAKAIRTVRESLSRDRRSARLNLALARLLTRRAANLARRRMRKGQQHALTEASKHYQIALAAQPTPKACIALGLVERQRGDFDSAAKAFQQAIELDPNNAMALTSLGNLQVDNGDIDAAIQTLNKSLAVAPENAMTHFRLSRTQKFRPGPTTDAYADTLQRLLDESSRPARDQVHLNFALAKVADDSGQYDRAWDHYDRANRLKPGHSDQLSQRVGRANRSSFAENTDALINFFTRDRIADIQVRPSSTLTPVFIVGMPRSGTTLTEQILSSHPAIFGAGELKDVEQIRQRIAKHHLVDQTNVVTGPAAKYPAVFETIPSATLQDLSAKHIGLLDGLRDSETHVVDKMPTNFMQLGLIAALFPSAKIIHCRRDPMDVLVSCYCQNLSAPFCDLDALAEYYLQYRRLMDHWDKVLPLSIHHVDYESTVANTEATSRQLIEHCGLSWDERCLNFHKNDRAVHTPSKWQVRQPMYSSSVGKWKRFESKLQQIADIVYQREVDSESSLSQAINAFHSSVA